MAKPHNPRAAIACRDVSRAIQRNVSAKIDQAAARLAERPIVVRSRESLEREFREHSAEEFTAVVNKTWDEFVAFNELRALDDLMIALAAIGSLADILCPTARKQEMRWRRRRAQRKV